MMRKKLNNQLLALQKASKAKSQNTSIKVQEAIRFLTKNKLAINFNSVAKVACISRTWLYSQKNIKQKIESARKEKNKIPRMINFQNLLKRKESEICILEKKIEKLNNCIGELRQRLEIVHGELYKNKK